MRRQYLPKLRFQTTLRARRASLLRTMLTDERVVLLYTVLAMGLLCFFVGVDDAYAISIKVVQNGILESNLVMQFQAEEVFTEKVVKFLNRGFTIKIEYKIELWRSRRYWFDHLDSQHSISYQIDFEPLEKRYVCLKSHDGEAAKSKLDRQLDNIIGWTTRPEPPLSIIPLEQLDLQAEYYYNIEIAIATLTTENIRHLQTWLGKFGEKEDEPSSFTKTSFKVARDFISSRNHKKLSERFEKFHPQNLPKLGK